MAQTKSDGTVPVKAGFEITSPKVQVSKVQDCQFPVMTRLVF